MTNLVWVDLETTGLDPQKDDILEVSVIVTDQNLVMQDAPFTRVVLPGPGWADKIQANKYVREMHNKSGLRAELDAISDLPFSERRHHFLHTVEEGAVEYLQQFGESFTMPLAGSTVNFDRAFLLEHMRYVHEYLHYRNIDVSTVKRCAAMWVPEVAAAWEAQAVVDKVHRAEADLRESIAELQHYRESIFELAGRYIDLANS